MLMCMVYSVRVCMRMYRLVMPPSVSLTIPDSLTAWPRAQIEGMTCSSCVHMIERTLKNATGVEKAVVALATCRGHVEFDPAVIGPRDIIRVVEVRWACPLTGRVGDVHVYMYVLQV